MVITYWYKYKSSSCSPPPPLAPTEVSPPPKPNVVEPLPIKELVAPALCLIFVSFEYAIPEFIPIWLLSPINALSFFSISLRYVFKGHSELVQLSSWT